MCPSVYYFANAYFEVLLQISDKLGRTRGEAYRLRAAQYRYRFSVRFAEMGNHLDVQSGQLMLGAFHAVPHIVYVALIEVACVARLHYSPARAPCQFAYGYLCIRRTAVRTFAFSRTADGNSHRIFRGLERRLFTILANLLPSTTP